MNERAPEITFGDVIVHYDDREIFVTFGMLRRNPSIFAEH